MKLEYEAISIFKSFKKFVDKYLSTQICEVQSDWGVEFRVFKLFLLEQGIQFRHSCLHIYAQNGRIERKHRHIVELCLAMLVQATMPLSLWFDVFALTVLKLTLYQPKPYMVSVPIRNFTPKLLISIFSNFLVVQFFLTLGLIT